MIQIINLLVRENNFKIRIEKKNQFIINILNKKKKTKIKKTIKHYHN